MLRTSISPADLVLDAAVLGSAALLRERCAVRRDVGASSFTGVGRGGLPASLDAPLASAYPDRHAAADEKRSEGRLRRGEWERARGTRSVVRFE